MPLKTHPPRRPPRTLAHALRALGRDELPERVRVGGKLYTRTRIVKHDFYAATGFYSDEDGAPAVLKMGRTEDFAGFPLQWLGQFLCRREMRFYQKLADLPNIPAVLGMVGKTGFLHAYVHGRPLAKDKPVPDNFFGELKTLLEQIHARGIAYVDTNKPENILLGDDNRPHLIDFQISWDLHELGNTWLNRIILRRMQHEDLYHFLKHKKRMRPDQLTEQEKVDAEQRSWFITAHRFVSMPYKGFRRRTFTRLRDSGQLLPEGSK